jgi:hypothetical protein
VRGRGTPPRCSEGIGPFGEEGLEVFLIGTAGDAVEFRQLHTPAPVGLHLPIALEIARVVDEPIRKARDVEKKLRKI